MQLHAMLIDIMFISIRRAFTCDSKSKICSVSTDVEAKNSQTPPNNLYDQHHQQCSNCTGYAKSTIGNPNAKAKKKLKIHLKKPLLKSIILSTTNNNNNSVLNIKRESVTTVDDNYNNLTNECNSNLKALVQPIVAITGECLTSKFTEPTLFNEMQFTDTKKTKQINSYFKSNDFLQQNERSYSPPLPATHRLASMVSNDAQYKTTVASAAMATTTINNHLRRTNSSRDRKPCKRRKKRRRSYSKDSR